ncbi:MAG: nascent polypeptide-associated complex protein [Candidatus Micrarchaeota archaeon]|nr:nascent polypeptide-associated complex protein [Candidatus Micrarchaeota archaeon]MDE1804431.1 nascent polypeptide-associated complex protein [Candidatus Micrarchaeota archaeon]MDE1847201.1 nascent polypeptide-associated complex protein [Candidatus Micrarchaeota archaeon]
MPNIDPKTLKTMMARMGIKSREIPAIRVVIEGSEKDIVIENPQVMSIEAQGNLSFQISGNVTEREKQQQVEISEDDVKTVREQTGSDEQSARKALEETNGDIAEAIIRIKGE